MGLSKVFDVAKNLLDVMFAMTKVRCTRLLDIETCSVTVTKAYILLLAFCKALIMYIECYSLLPIVIPSSLLHLLPYVLFSGLLMTFSILLTLVYGVFSSSKFANFI